MIRTAPGLLPKPPPSTSPHRLSMSAPKPPPRVASSHPPPASPRTLYDIILPGTHDSASYTTRPDLVSRSTVLPLHLPPIRVACATVQTDFARTQTLCVLEQLRAGARFLDIRVTKRPPASRDRSFWTHHGMVLCVPLADILDQISTFHDETAAVPVVVVAVFRSSFLTAAEEAELAAFVLSHLRHSVYPGSAADLRQRPLAALERNVVAGLRGGSLDVSWGQDPWLDTYSAERKIKFVTNVLNDSAPRAGRDNLLVLGWTVTPSPLDVVFRVLSLGMLRPSVLTEAEKMNVRVDAYIDTEAHALRDKANVVFFDAFSKHVAELVCQLNPVSPASSDSEEGPET